MGNRLVGTNPGHCAETNKGKLFKYSGSLQTIKNQLKFYNKEKMKYPQNWGFSPILFSPNFVLKKLTENFPVL